jgi:ribosomal protein RSM22 (predicted rRNA methylase)
MMSQEAIEALAAMLEGVSRIELARRAERLSALYRAGEPSRVAVRDRLDALAYAVARMPATYAAVEAAAHEALRAGRLIPAREGIASILDLGAGPGAAALAVLSHLRESGEGAAVARVDLVEAHDAFRALARALLAGLGQQIAVVAADLRHPPATLPPADLVVASYVLVELSNEEACALAERAAGLARKAVLFVEPGTPAGFARIRTARDVLIKAGFSPLAPCPGPLPCPMTGGDWCHFSVRLARSRDHKFVKGAEAPFEDERFCYFAAARATTRPAAARVLAAPSKGRGGIRAKLCTPDGVVFCDYRRSDKAAWKSARKLAWGDAIESGTASG